MEFLWWKYNHIIRLHCCKNKKSRFDFEAAFTFVQAERLELSHLAALDPKSSVSTNSTTPAKGVQI